MKINDYLYLEINYAKHKAHQWRATVLQGYAKDNVINKVGCDKPWLLQMFISLYVRVRDVFAGCLERGQDAQGWTTLQPLK